MNKTLYQLNLNINNQKLKILLLPTQLEEFKLKKEGDHENSKSCIKAS